MYFQIKQELEGRMLSGEFQVGMQVPTEHALCDLFGVSRITARKALLLLQEEGIISRVRGRGSFVEKMPKGRPGVHAHTATEIAVCTQLQNFDQPQEREDWGSRILRHLEMRLLHEGYHLVPVPFLRGPDSTQQVLERLDSQAGRFAGVVLFGWNHSEQLYSELDQRLLPFVTINQRSRLQTSNFVAVDNYGGGRQIGRLFSKNNYAPVMVFGPAVGTTQSINDKLFGFLHGYTAEGRRINQVLQFDTADTEPNEEETAKLIQLLLSPGRPRAVFCHGDLLAARVLRIAAELGLSVPGDLAVVGSTGLSLAEHTSPPMTVLAQPMNAMGEEAALLILRMIKNRQVRLPGHYVPCTLTPRQSCPVPPDFFSPDPPPKSQHLPSKLV